MTWLQREVLNWSPRARNLADMLTHTPSAKELEVFVPLMGLRCCSDQEKELVATRQYKPVPVKAEMVSKAVSVQWVSRDDRENVELEWCWNVSWTFKDLAQSLGQCSMVCAVSMEKKTCTRIGTCWQHLAMHVAVHQLEQSQVFSWHVSTSGKCWDKAVVPVLSVLSVVRGICCKLHIWRLLCIRDIVPFRSHLRRPWVLIKQNEKISLTTTHKKYPACTLQPPARKLALKMHSTAYTTISCKRNSSLKKTHL